MKVHDNLKEKDGNLIKDIVNIKMNNGIVEVDYYDIREVLVDEVRDCDIVKSNIEVEVMDYVDVEVDD